MSQVTLEAKSTMNKDDYTRLYNRLKEKIGPDNLVSIIVNHHEDGDYTVECYDVTDHYNLENEEHQEQVTYVASDEFFDELVTVMEDYEESYGEIDELFITLEIL